MLVLAPVGQDAVLTARALARSGVRAEVCASLEELCARLADPYGAILVAEESFGSLGVERFNATLSRQPAWSDIPVIILTGGGMVNEANVRAWRDFAAVGNATLLERPVKTMTLVSASQVALRARRRQYQVRKLLEEQKTATAIRDEFISIASHELKTPLTALKLQLQLNRRFIDRGDEEHVSRDRVRKLIDVSEQAAERLNRLVDDMLDSTRIQSGKLTLEPTQVNLTATIEELVERQMPRLFTTGNSVELKLEHDVSGTWDRMRLEQVLSNLLSNAQRYAPGTRLTISLEARGDHVRLALEDEGPGISRENLERIFQRFERAENERKGVGLGLGLYICREIVRGHGGTIRAESERGKGARFVIDLPTLALAERKLKS